MTAIDFLRHGATEAGDALVGRTDPPLSEAGRASVAGWSAGRRWSAVIASPLRRARETAEIAAAGSGRAVEIEPAWREIDFGDWDGKPRAALAADPRLVPFYADPENNPAPNGESLGEVRRRVEKALRILAARGPGPVIVVAHGGTIRVALSILLALPVERLWAIRIACGTLVRVRMDDDPEHGLWGEIVEILQPVRQPCP